MSYALLAVVILLGCASTCLILRSEKPLTQSDLPQAHEFEIEEITG